MLLAGKRKIRLQIFFGGEYFIQGCFILMLSDLVVVFWTNLKVDCNEYDGN